MNGKHMFLYDSLKFPSRLIKHSFNIFLKFRLRWSLKKNIKEVLKIVLILHIKLNSQSLLPSLIIFQFNNQQSIQYTQLLLVMFRL
jgi:hypothetical protein